VLEDLTVASFAPAVGEAFALDAGDAGALQLKLLEARLTDPEAPATGSGGTRAGFVLTFRGPVDPVLPQRIYRIEHASTGPLEIFIVPIARDEAGTSYEAIFS
jgi:hypothetical protein